MKKFYKTVAFEHEAEEFWAIYKASTCAVERRRAQFFAFLAEGKSETETLELTRYSVSGARQIIERYNRLGLSGLKDARHENQGAPPVLTAEEQQRFAAALQQDFDQGVVWDGNRAQSWVKEVLGKEIYLGRGYERMHQAGFSPQRPRPQHKKGDPVAKEAFKTKF